MFTRRWSLIAVIAVLGLLLVIATAWGWMGFPMMGYGMMGWGWMGPGMWAFLVILAAGLYLLFTATPTYGRERRLRAIRIAEERYARGEITAEELDGIRENLRRR